MILIGIAIRILFLYIVSPDITVFEGVWYDHFIDVGRIDAFKDIFYNYQPPLLYLIDITTLFRFVPKEISIKTISIIFDFFAAFGVYRVVELRFPKNYQKWTGFFATLLLPTVFIESSMWGQSDIIYTCFLIWSLYFLMKKNNALAILSFSVAFAFKLQAVIFIPIFVLLLFKKKFPFWMFFIVPIVYFISVVPAWLAGSPLDKLLTIYFTQFNTYYSLSMRAPNLYIFINPGNSFDLIVRIGLAITFLVVLIYLLLRILKFKDLSAESLCLDAAMLTIFIPFLLPKMHERYFFAGGLFLLVLAFFNRKLIWAAVLSQASSIISFIPYFSGWSDIFAKVGAILNVFLIIGLLFYFFDYQKEIREKEFIALVIGSPK